ncbi:MAG: hypothetical protein P8185_19645 [Deltaproteobacteria bacterium]|jgi:hypothetical protein
MIRYADQIASSSRHGVTPRNDGLSEHIFDNRCKSAGETQACDISRDDYVIDCPETDREVRRQGKEIKKMENKKEWRLAVLLVLALVFIIVINAKLPLQAENRELAKAVFYVT